MQFPRFSVRRLSMWEKILSLLHVNVRIADLEIIHWWGGVGSEDYEILELARTGLTGLSRGADDIRYLP